MGGGLALQPESSAPSPKATDGAKRREAWSKGNWGSTAGPVPYFCGRHSTGSVAASLSIDRAGVLALFLPAISTEGRRLKTMTSRTQGWRARRRGELKRGSGLLAAADAQRSLNARQAHGSRIQARPVGQSDSRYVYLRQSHD